MQPIKILSKWLFHHSTSGSYLYTPRDLRSLYTAMSDSAFKTLLSRAVKQGILEKVCRGLYAFESSKNSRGLLLFHAAAQLRSNEFNYISLETALSDAGVISQVLPNYITVVSSGRTNKISCGDFGTIEFVHTSREPTEVMQGLIYDESHKLWRANPQLAFEDMKKTHRNLGLINQDLLNESV